MRYVGAIINIYIIIINVSSFVLVGNIKNEGSPQASMRGVNE
jgi:hypothetical protein